MKRIILLLAAMTMVMSTAAFAQSADADKYYDTARALYVAGDSVGAKKNLEKALELDPKHEKSKKLLEKIGASGDAAPATAAAGAKSSAPGEKLLTKDEIDGALKVNISNTFTRARTDIYAYMSQSLKDEVSNSISRAVKDALVKDVVNEQVNIVAQRLVKDEIERAILLVMSEYGMKAEEINKQGVTDKVKGILDAGTVPYVPTAIIELKSKEKVKELYDQAMKMVSAEDFDQAKKLLEEAAKLDPKNADVAKALEKVRTEKKK